MTDPLEGRFVPPESQAAHEFWEATRAGRLELQWCEECDRAVHFPRTHCPRCSGSDLGWRTSSGRGVIYAASVHHLPGRPAFAAVTPYVVALVELEGGARLMTNIVGCDPEQATVGYAVVVEWEPLPDGRRLPLFTLA